MLKTLNEMASDHLNCKEYEYTFQKLNEIKNLQNKFNNQINIFLDDNRKSLKRFLISNNVKFTDDQLNMLLRYYLYWIADKNRMSEGFDSRIENYHGKIRIGDDEIINPFQNIEGEIKNYIHTTSDEQIKELKKLIQMNDNINIVIKEFQESLEPIIANSVVGIKGICKIENDLSWIRKIKCIFD